MFNIFHFFKNRKEKKRKIKEELRNREIMNSQPRKFIPHRYTYDSYPVLDKETGQIRWVENEWLKLHRSNGIRFSKINNNIINNIKII